MSQRRLLLLAALVQLVWATVPSASRAVLAAMPVSVYTALRLTLAAAVFGALAARGAAAGTARPSGALLAVVAVLGVLGHGAASFLALNGLLAGGVAFFAMVSLAAPLLLPLLAARVLGERLTRATVVAGTLAAAGVALLVVGRVQLTSLRAGVTAGALVLAAYALEAVSFLSSKRLRARVPLPLYLFVAQGAAALAAWGVVVAEGAPLAASPAAWAGLLYVALVGCVGCTMAWYALLARSSAQRLAFLQYVHGLAATALGAAVFGETVDARMLAGGALLVAGILVATLWPARRRALTPALVTARAAALDSSRGAGCTPPSPPACDRRDPPSFAG